MSGATRGIGWWLAAAILMIGASRAEAAEIKVLSAGAVRAIVTELSKGFEKETGTRLRSPSAPSASPASG